MPSIEMISFTIPPGVFIVGIKGITNTYLLCAVIFSEIFFFKLMVGMMPSKTPMEEHLSGKLSNST